MKLTLARDIRFEEIDGEAVVLDRVGATLHRVTGDAAEALKLVQDGIDQVDVPGQLAPAMTELVDRGVVVSSDWSRRKLLKMAGASMAGAGIITVALASPAAAASGTATAELRKTINGNNQTNPTPADLCTSNLYPTGNSVRGQCVFTRTENPAPAVISVTVTMTTRYIRRRRLSSFFNRTGPSVFPAYRLNSLAMGPPRSELPDLRDGRSNPGRPF